MTIDIDVVYNMDCIDGMRQIDDNTIDLIVTDPPYGISFMNKDWDKFNEITDIHDQGAYGKVKGFKNLPRNKPTNMREFFVPVWKEALRVPKPGAFVFVMCSPRQDVMAQQITALSDAGFNTGFTSIYWTYASGFPKAQNVAKKIDQRFKDQAIKALMEFVYITVFKPMDIPLTVYEALLPGIDIGEVGFEPDNIGTVKGMGKQNPDFNGTAQGRKENYLKPEYIKVIPTSEESKKLSGSYSGFQPKPAVEVILVVMKPLKEKTYVDQALKNGKGITWLDDCRIPYNNEVPNVGGRPNHGRGEGYGFEPLGDNVMANQEGRFPANLIVNDEVMNIEGDDCDISRYYSLDAWWQKHIAKLPEEQRKMFPFLYVPKASQTERNQGLYAFDDKTVDDGRKKSIDNPFQRGETPRKNTHPTVKPINLMTYLITLGSRTNDLVLDPFIGSGTTAIAARMINRHFIGFESTNEYYEIAKARLSTYTTQRKLSEII